jgi:hypothetical protein
MNFYNIFLLLLVVLSSFFESPQHGKPPDSLDFPLVAVCPNSSSDSLGILAPVLPQGEMFGSVLTQNNNNNNNHHHPAPTPKVAVIPPS